LFDERTQLIVQGIIERLLTQAATGKPLSPVHYTPTARLVDYGGGAD
jgi:hypothetical protein